MAFHLSLPHGLTLHGLVTVLAVLIYILSSHLMHQRRHPTAAVSWMLFILLVPYIALPAYLAFGSRKLPRPGAPRQQVMTKAIGPASWARDTLIALGQPAPVPYAGLNIHRDGIHARAALLNTIESATSSIDVCTFLIGRDGLGEAVLDALCHKAEQGVRVRLLRDGLGSLMARPPDVRRLISAGGECLSFVPPFSSPLKGRTNLRDHRKLLVTDAQTDHARLWCGGRNLASAYFEGAPGQAPWRDLSFDLHGPLTRQAQALFQKDWEFARSPRSQASLPLSSVDLEPAPGLAQRTCAQVVASGPDQADDTLHALIITAAYRARTRLALATPYFVPDEALLMALCMAARRGVTVDLLLPARSNHRLSDLARARSLRSLAQAGGRIWLAPTMMHAKLVVADEVLALAGSANLDPRSLFLNYEVMCAFHAPVDVQRFADWFDRERQTARPYVAKAPGLLRDVAEGMLLWLGFQL